MRRLATNLTPCVRLAAGALTALSSPQHPENVLAHGCSVQSLPKVLSLSIGGRCVICLLTSI